jgi:hypothetical protein
VRATAPAADADTASAAAMLIYRKGLWALPLLFRDPGTVFLRSTPPALFSALLAGVLSWGVAGAYLDAAVETPLTYTQLGTITAFALTFRANSSYQRYCRAAECLQQLGANLTNVVTAALSFEAATLGGGTAPWSPEAAKAYAAFSARLLHAASLLHALCLQHWRHDWELDNLVAHAPGSAPPPANVVARLPRGARIVNAFRLGASRREAAAHCAAGRLAVLPPPGAPPGAAASVPELRVLAARGAAVKGAQAEAELDEAAAPPGALERAHAARAWLSLLLAERMAADARPGAWAPAVMPPTTAPIYACLSAGWDAFEGGRAISAIPFPFSYAQLASGLLVIQAFALPLVITAWMSEAWMCVSLGFGGGCVGFVGCVLRGRRRARRRAR